MTATNYFAPSTASQSRSRSVPHAKRENRVIRHTVASRGYAAVPPPGGGLTLPRSRHHALPPLIRFAGPEVALCKHLAAHRHDRRAGRLHVGNCASGGWNRHLVALVAAGLEVALAPTSVRHLRVNGVTHRPLTAATARVPLAIAYKDGPVSPLIRGYRDLPSRDAQPAALTEVARAPPWTHDRMAG